MSTGSSENSIILRFDFTFFVARDPADDATIGNMVHNKHALSQRVVSENREEEATTSHDSNHEQDLGGIENSSPVALHADDRDSDMEVDVADEEGERSQLSDSIIPGGEPTEAIEVDFDPETNTSASVVENDILSQSSFPTLSQEESQSIARKPTNGIQQSGEEDWGCDNPGYIPDDVSRIEALHDFVCSVEAEHRTGPAGPAREGHSDLNLGVISTSGVQSQQEESRTEDREVSGGADDSTDSEEGSDPKSASMPLSQTSDGNSTHFQPDTPNSNTSEGSESLLASRQSPINFVPAASEVTCIESDDIAEPSDIQENDDSDRSGSNSPNLLDKQDNNNFPHRNYARYTAGYTAGYTTGGSENNPVVIEDEDEDEVSAVASSASSSYSVVHEAGDGLPFTQREDLPLTPTVSSAASYMPLSSGRPTNRFANTR